VFFVVVSILIGNSVIVIVIGLKTICYWVVHPLCFLRFGSEFEILEVFQVEFAFVVGFVVSSGVGVLLLNVLGLAVF